MSAASRPVRRVPAAGFTLLEILIAMAIFTVLGTMVVYFMRQSLDIFYQGTRESAALDRMDTVLPQVREDLRALIVPDNFEPPPEPLSEQELARLGLSQPPPPPRVQIALRSGYVNLRQVEDPTYKDYACPFIAFVVADAGEWSDKLKRRAGNTPASADSKPLTPQTVLDSDADTEFLPTGGLMEVVWIAVPADAMRTADDEGPRYPAIMDLYRGFRTPIGDAEKSLLDPHNFDTPEDIRKNCRPVAEGLLHFGATWRRVFATSWEPSFGVAVGNETLPYVGPQWDSTRGIDRGWPLFRGPESLGDPSDDVFPKFVRLEATLAGASQFGPGRGELQLVEALSADATRARVSNADELLRPNLGKDRYIKIGSEWLEYAVRDVNWETREVRLRRGARGTKPQAHPSDSWCYVGTPNHIEVELPVYRDRFVKKERSP